MPVAETRSRRPALINQTAFRMVTGSRQGPSHGERDFARRAWQVAARRLAWVAGVFCVVLGGLLVHNSFRLYRGAGDAKLRLVEARELLPLKNSLRDNPRDAELKEDIRERDQLLREEYFRRKEIAERGAMALLGGAAVFVAALQAALLLKRSGPAVPDLSRAPEDPAKEANRAGQAVAGVSLALAGLTAALVWGVTPEWDGKDVRLRGAASGGGAAEVPGTAPGTVSAAGDPEWYPSQDDIANNWPRFRGPGGLGITQFEGLPETWDGKTGTNILWKTEIPLPGENSPVVWGDRIFLTGATSKRREVYCIDVRSGELLWGEPVSTAQGGRAEPPEVMEDTGYAASTGVTDGRRVFAIFANGEVAGFDVAGKRLWARHLGTPENMYGYATSLAMWRNRVLVVFDQGEADEERSKILALDAVTGETVWSTPRPVANSWSTPIVITAAGKEQVVTCASPWAIAYDPAEGSEIWKAKCMEGDVAPSPTFANGLVYVASDQDSVAAIHPDGAGDVTGRKMAWSWDKGDLPDLCSLLCDGPRLYTLIFGVLHAFDAMNGEHLWKHDFEEQFQASPTLVNGRLWLLNSNGVMIMGTADGEGFAETSRAPLGEKCGASPAFAPGRVYLRGRKHLYCIGRNDER